MLSARIGDIGQSSLIRWVKLLVLMLALMLLTDTRRAGRTGPDGELIPLTKQDRTLWERPSPRAPRS
jgi:hypothetical protein